MANYPVNPEPFLPPDFEIEHGGQNRVVLAVVNLSGEPIYAHEQFTIAVDVDGVLHPSDNHDFLQQIRHYLINELNLHVASTCLHPLGVGLIKLESPRHRDGLMLGNLHEVDGGPNQVHQARLRAKPPFRALHQVRMDHVLRFSPGL
jgi:hypothetical protein